MSTDVNGGIRRDGCDGGIAMLSGFLCETILLEEVVLAPNYKFQIHFFHDVVQLSHFFVFWDIEANPTCDLYI